LGCCYFIVLTVNAYLTCSSAKSSRTCSRAGGRIAPDRTDCSSRWPTAVKFLFKEDPTPAGVDKFVYYLAPLMALALALTAIALIPLGRIRFACSDTTFIWGSRLRK